MASTTAPDGVVQPLLSPGWLTYDDSVQQTTGHVAVTQDNDTTIPNPQVPTGDGPVEYNPLEDLPGGIGEPWEPSASFPWPATPSSGDGVVAVLPGMTGNGNDNDDPAGMPGYDGPKMDYGGAYALTSEQGGYDAVAQQTDTLGFNVLRPGANMGYQRVETRLMGNDSPGYINVWSPIRNVTPPVKTANQFTAQPFTNMDGSEGSLPPYASLSLANSGGTAYYVNGPAAPDVSDARPSAGYSAPDPAANWA